MNYLPIRCSDELPKGEELEHVDKVFKMNYLKRRKR